jgi:hypothetical protein
MARRGQNRCLPLVPIDAVSHATTVPERELLGLQALGEIVGKRQRCNVIFADSLVKAVPAHH